MGGSQSKTTSPLVLPYANGTLPNGRANTSTSSQRSRSDEPDEDEIKEGKAALTRVVRYLEKKNVGELGTRETLHMVMELDTPFGDLPSSQETEKIREYCRHLIKINFPKLFVKIWKKIHSAIDTKSVEEHDDTFAFQVSVLECIKIALAHLCNHSSELACSLGEAGTVELFLGDLQHQRLQPDKFPALNVDATKDIYFGILQSTLVCLHSLVKNWADNKQYVSNVNGMMMLHKYARKCKNRDIKVISLFTLSYVLNEDEYELISSSEDIRLFVATLEAALDSEDVPRIWETGFFSFSAKDIVAAINQLALYDDNKVRLVNGRVLHQLLRLLDDETDSTEEEKELTAISLWTLSFHADNRERMEYIVPELERLLGSSNKIIRKACCGTLWQLQRNKRPQPRRPLLTGSGHVMISYQWDCNEVVMKVKERLKAAGYRVWVEANKTVGTTFQAVTEAVEKAEVVIICVSAKYKNSLICRTEAEYAYDLRKPTIPVRVQMNSTPEGWLASMFGTKLYFDLSDEKKLNKMGLKLIKELGERGKSKIHAYRDSFRVKSSTPKKAPPRELNPLPPTPDLEDFAPLPRSPSFTESVLETWTRKDIKYWLKRNGLGHLSYRFRGFDGESMHELKVMQQKAPEFFYSSLQTKFGFRNVLDITKFTRALKEIE
ncbi:uncharacterized protein [Ptychodera flava]|uniref:uncharacterized protein n=1 Tax=Ptychodera flava TaxID=63121 RepID=UPI003969BD58